MIIYKPELEKSSIELKLESGVKKRSLESTNKAKDTDFLSMGKISLKANRKRVQMIFQDLWESLNPRILLRNGLEILG